MAITPADGVPLWARVAAVLDAGVDAVLIREPGLDAAALHRLVEGFPGRLILHDKTPGARAAAAGLGLHLPGGIDPAPIRGRITGRLGASCHSLAALRRAAAAGCDYATLSPIFSPISKPDDRRLPLGPAALADAPLPVLALGGIGPGQVAACRAAGAAGVAAISAFFPAGADAAGCRAAAQAMRAAAQRAR